MNAYQVVVNIAINAGGTGAGVNQFNTAMNQIKQSASDAAKQSALSFETIFGANFFANLAADFVKSFVSALKDGVIYVTQFAARTQELGVAEEALAKANKLSLASIREQEQALKDANIATQTARESLSQFLAAGLPLNKVSPLASAAKDLAVIAGVSSSEEFNRLIDGITTLQIRVLRTAGVYISLRDEEKKYAEQNHRTVESLSEQEKQQIALNSVLTFATRVTGTYEMAMTTAAKQQRSLVRIQQDFADAVGSQLIPVLYAGVVAYSALLKTLTRAPALFDALVIGVTALTVAVIAMNTAQIASLPIIGSILSSAKALIPAMFGLAAAEDAVAVSSFAIGAGWVGLIGVAITVGIGLGQLTTAHENLKAVTEESVQATFDQGVAYMQTEKTLQSLYKANLSQAEITAQITELYGNLDAASQLRVRGNSTEEISVQKLADEYHRLALAKQENLGRDADVNAQKLIGLSQEYAAIQKNADAMASQIDKLKEYARDLSQLNPSQGITSERAGGRTTTTTAADELKRTQSQIDTLTNSWNTLTNSQDEGARSLRSVGDEFQNTYKSTEMLDKFLGTTTPDLIKMSETNRGLAKDADTAAAGVDGLARNLGLMHGPVTQATADLDRLAAAIRDASNQSDRRKAITDAIGNIAENATSLTDAKQKLANLRSTDTAVDSQIKKTQAVEKYTKALDEIVNPREAPKGHKRKTELESLSDSLNKLKDDVRSFTDLSSKTFTLRFEKEDLERTKRDYEKILDLRHELQLPLDSQLPTNHAEIEEMVRRLDRMKAVKDDVLKLTEEQFEAEKDLAVAIAGQSIPVVNAETRAQTAYAKAVRDRSNADQQLTADVIVASRLRQDRINDETGGVYRSYQQLRVDLLKESEQIDNDLAKNKTLSRILSGDEAGIQSQIENYIKLEPAKTPDELTQVANNTLAISKDTSKIAQMLGGGSSAGSAGSSDTYEHTAKGLEQIGNKFGFRSTSGFVHSGHNKNSLHYLNLADDFSIKGKTAAQINEFLEGAIEAGARVVDEITRPKGMKVWGGSNIHLEWNSKGRPSYLPRNPAVAQLERDLKAGKGRAAGMGTSLSGDTGSDITVSASAASFDYKTLLQDNVTKKAENDRIDSNNKATLEIWANEARLKVNLMDLDKQIGVARTTQALQRRDEDRSTAVAIKLLEEDVANLEKGSAVDVERVRQNERKTRLTESKTLSEQLITFDEQFTHYAENSAKRIEVAYKQTRNQFYQLDDVIGRTRANAEYLASLKAGDSRAIGAEYTKGDEQNVQTATQRQQEIIALRRKLFSTSDATVAVNAEEEAQRYQLAWLKAIDSVREADIVARESMIASQVKIADATVYHADQANAKVLEFLASQKSISESIGDFKVGVIQGTYSLIDKGLDRITAKLGVFSSAIKTLLSDLIHLALNKAFMMLFGLGTATGVTSGSAGAGAGVASSIVSSFGNFLGGSGGGGSSSAASVGGFFAGGGASSPYSSSSGGTGPGGMIRQADGSFVRASYSTAQNPFAQFANFQNSLSSGGDELVSHSISDAVAGSAVGKGGILSGAGGKATSAGAGVAGSGGMLKSLGAMLPMLGMSIGASLGGQSIAGNILGGVGGTAAGVLGGIATGALNAGTMFGGLFGAGGALSIGGLSAAMSATVVLAPIAAALIIGSLILGKNKLRRQEEQQRTQILTDSKSKMQSLIDQVRSGSLDSASALAQAQVIRGDYITQVSQLKDTKTRNIALQTVRELDAMIDTLKREGAVAEQAASRFKLLVPTFASGGSISYGVSMQGYTMSNEMPMIAKREDEVVLTRQHLANLQLTTQSLANAGVPGYAHMADRSFTRQAPQNFAQPKNYMFAIVADDAAADKIVSRSKPGTVAQKVRLHARQNSRDDSATALLYSALG